MDHYPLLNLFWTTLWFFLFLAWIVVLFRIVGDVFASADLSGPAKALWMVFLIFLPWLGVVIYLLARGDNMHRRHAGRHP